MICVREDRRLRRGGVLALALAFVGCAEVEDPGFEYHRLDNHEPGRAGCTVTASEDRDSNGYVDFERHTTYDAAGSPVLVRETETDNGGAPPEDPATFRVDTEFDERANPVLQQEGPDDDSPRTQTAWRWEYGRSLLRQEAEVDRRNNGEDLTRWSMEYERTGRLLSWQIDASATTGLQTEMTYVWGDLGIAEVHRSDGSGGEEPEPTAGWRLETDELGRVLRRVEIVDGVEGRQAVFTRDDEGRLRRRVGGWGALGEWSSADATFSSPCWGD